MVAGWLVGWAVCERYLTAGFGVGEPSLLGRLYLASTLLCVFGRLSDFSGDGIISDLEDVVLTWLIRFA